MEAGAIFLIISACSLARVGPPGVSKTFRIIHDLRAGRWARLGPNPEKFNPLNYDADQARPLAESRVRLLQARQALLQLLHSVSDEQLLNEYGRQQVGWWAKWTTYGHYEQHLSALATFRQGVLGSNDHPDS